MATRNYKKAAGKSKGATTGLGITIFCSTLFEANELAPKKKKATDEKLIQKIAKEFPGRKISKELLNGTKTLNDYRNRYNKGKFTRGLPPKKYSFRYGPSGTPVNGRTGSHELCREEIQLIRRNHTTLREQALREIEEAQYA